MQKIVICGSMKFSKEMLDLKSKLSEIGFSNVVIPENAEKYASGEWQGESSHESVKNKVEKDLIRAYYNEIKDSDIVIIANYDKGGVKNYIGGNSFIEAAFAHVLNKKLYFLFDIPEMSYTDELKAINPIILNNDLEKLLN